MRPKASYFSSLGLSFTNVHSFNKHILDAKQRPGTGLFTLSVFREISTARRGNTGEKSSNICVGQGKLRTSQKTPSEIRRPTNMSVLLETRHAPTEFLSSFNFGYLFKLRQNILKLKNKNKQTNKKTKQNKERIIHRNHTRE